MNRRSLILAILVATVCGMVFMLSPRPDQRMVSRADVQAVETIITSPASPQEPFAHQAEVASHAAPVTPQYAASGDPAGAILRGRGDETSAALKLAPAREEQLVALTWRNMQADVTYDANLLANSKSETQPGWVTSRVFKEGAYDVLLDTLEKVKRRRIFKMRLKYPEENENLGLIPTELRYIQDEKNLVILNYVGFIAPYASSEVFSASLHFPHDKFWADLTNGAKCEEILFVRTGWGIPNDGKYALNFNGRVYCRTALEQLTSIAQMGFCLEGQEC